MKPRTSSRLAILVSGACGWGVFASFCLFTTTPGGRELLVAIGVPWFYLIAGVCLVWCFVMSICCWLRHDWFWIVGLVLLFGVPAFLPQDELFWFWSIPLCLLFPKLFKISDFGSPYPVDWRSWVIGWVFYLAVAAALCLICRRRIAREKR